MRWGPTPPGGAHRLHPEQGYQVIVGNDPIGESELGNASGGKAIKIVPVVDGANSMDGGPFLDLIVMPRFTNQLALRDQVFPQLPEPAHVPNRPREDGKTTDASSRLIA